MNPDLVKTALHKVGDPNFLINLVSKRVRQLTGPGGPGSRPLLSETAGLSAADIAMVELMEDKMGWEIPSEPVASDPAPSAKKSKKR